MAEDDRYWTCKVWLSSTRHPQKVVFGLLVVFFTVVAQPCAGQLCYGVFVTGAVDEPRINGGYYLINDLLCNEQRIWMQGSGVSGQVNYITYLLNLADTETLANTSTTVYKSGWVIGPTLCKTLSTILAINTYDNYEYLYPYNIPSGHWQEFDPFTNTFINNTQLVVTCNGYSSLSTGAIVGIVLGSIFCLILFVMLLACICNKCSNNKPRRRRRTQAPTTVIYATGPAGPAPGGTVTVIAPPPYDNLPPPPAYVPTVQPDSFMYDDNLYVNPATI